MATSTVPLYNCELAINCLDHSGNHTVMSLEPNLSLNRLVKKSVVKNTNKRVFAALLAQLCDSEAVSDNELLEHLLDLSALHNLPMARGRRAESIQLDYALEFFWSTGAKIAKFFVLLEQLSYTTQRKYVLRLKGRYMSEPKPDLVQDSIKHLSQYTLGLSSKVIKASPTIPLDLKNLWYQVVFMWGAILEADSSHYSSSSFKELCMAIMKASNNVEDPLISSYFLDRVNSVVKPTDRLQDFSGIPDHAQLIANQSAPKAQAYNLSSKKFVNYIRLKKVMWLNSQFSSWKFDTDLVPKFTSFFALSLKDKDAAILELTKSFFEGMLFALAADVAAYVRFNWKNYIVSRLTLQLRSIAGASLSTEMAEKFIKTVLDFDHPSLANMVVGGPKSPYDLRKEFLKSCAYKNLITYEQYTEAFALDKESYTLVAFEQETETLDRVVNLSSEFNSKLMNLNTEFTSLRESKFIEFLQKLPHTNFSYSEIQQKKLTALIVKLVSHLIKEKNDEKLSRLSLALSNCLPVANYLFFNDVKGPWLLLEPLVAYIDEEPFNVDEDDGNFSDTYASFGIILSSCICISKFFNIDFCHVNIKNSYTADFINKFFYRSGETFTVALKSASEEENTIATNFETLSNNWANALFDVNNDGLSDDLIKSVNVKQMYKFMFIIFKQAIVSRVIGSLSDVSLNNGIDYLSQNFSVPCSVGVMEWISTQIGVRHTNTDLMISILIKIMEGISTSESGSNTSGSNYVYTMILNIVGPGIIKRLKTVLSSEKATKLLDLLKSTVDLEYSEFDSPTTKLSGEIAMSKRIRDEVGSLVKNHDTSSNMPQMIKSWVIIHSSWNFLPESELYESILREEGRWQRHRKHALDDETKALLDFQAFMTVSNSSANHEEVLLCCGHLASSSKIGLSGAEGGKQFSSNVETHLSSIFEEPLKGEEASPLAINRDNADRPETSDLMTDFVMDDLFNGAADNVFDERELDHRIGLDQKDSPTGEPSPNLGAIYELLRFRSSKLVRITELLCSCSQKEQVESTARERLLQELQQWKRI